MKRARREDFVFIRPSFKFIRPFFKVYFHFNLSRRLRKIRFICPRKTRKGAKKRTIFRKILSYFAFLRVFREIGFLNLFNRRLFYFKLTAASACSPLSPRISAVICGFSFSSPMRSTGRKTSTGFFSLMRMYSAISAVP